MHYKINERKNHFLILFKKLMKLQEMVFGLDKVTFLTDCFDEFFNLYDECFEIFFYLLLKNLYSAEELEQNPSNLFFTKVKKRSENDLANFLDFELEFCEKNYLSFTYLWADLSIPADQDFLAKKVNKERILLQKKIQVLIGSCAEKTNHFKEKKREILLEIYNFSLIFLREQLFLRHNFLMNFSASKNQKEKQAFYFQQLSSLDWSITLYVLEVITLKQILKTI